VRAHPDAEGTAISVSDDGVGFAPERRPHGNGNGIGMDNVNQRLTKLFGPASALRIAGAAGGGTTVSFHVPAHVPTAAR